jgi:hypothetical protein
MKEKQESWASETNEGRKKGMQSLVGRTERRKPCGRSRRGGENNVGMDVK